MRFSANARTGNKTLLTSWRSSSDPSVGNYTAGVNPLGIAELFIWYNGHPFWRSGPWGGKNFIGIPGMNASVYLGGFSLEKEGDGIFTMSSIFEDPASRLTYVLTSDGKLTEQYWDYGKGGWTYDDWEAPSTECDIYGKCGPFGSCDAQNSPICTCLEGFVAKNQDEWNKGIWTSGCVRVTSLQCDRIHNDTKVGKEDGFRKLEMMKVPTFAEHWLNPSSEQECKDECLRNCSCVAYSFYNGYFCMAWTGNLIDIQKFSEGGTDLNIRLAHTEIGEEMMLVYEYLPNKSLDAFLFDSLRKGHLDWERRFDIINGICRGLLYLHRDSRLRIIHRDLKPSNILLDHELNPKISDFGMARIFCGNEDQVNTTRVVGTYGYMSPEYLMRGRFSEKSDVFSFGVLLLEIVSGRRNSSFYDNEHSLSLIGFAWKLWNEGDITALVDPAISDPSFQVEIFRCIQIGLLCVQEMAKDRPAVSTISSMLNSEIVDLPPPKKPAFVERQSSLDTESITQNQKINSINNVTISDLNGR
ncbi:hypothetical protein POTOM_040557 [Populus tomentosa]|uniref:non-specific serine/threonine protein kinase n=1 Tax=Populus tomentosa TaxID=118781 RepID=A0A8X7YKA1_POPTO|nr:hypothetical protein POTOM_040557 [Populus tomentosa]